jgi:hypothetical protein
MNCIPEDDAHTEECIKGINPCYPPAPDDDTPIQPSESAEVPRGTIERNPAYDGPMGVFADYGEADDEAPTLDDVMLGDPDEYDDTGGEL